MKLGGLPLALGLIVAIAACNTENMAALVILVPLSFGLMLWGAK